MHALLLAAVVAVALSGCGHGEEVANARDLRQLKEEVHALRQQRDQDRRKLDAFEAHLLRLARTAQPPAAPPPEPVSPSVRTEPPTGLRVTRLEPPPAREPEEDSSAFIAVIADDGVRSPSARGPMGGPSGGPDTAPPLPTEVELVEPSLSAPTDEAARAALADGDFSRAVTLFEQFAARHPRHPGADNALLGAGDAWMRLGKPGRALALYERVATEYPAGDAVPHALLRYGEACLALGRLPAAHAALRRILTDFPSSAAATSARAQLGKLSPQG